jgi:hypothetical protein
MTTPAGLNARQRRIWRLFDFSVGRGLEVGPLWTPMATTEHSDVTYVDVFTREQLRTTYRAQPEEILDRIPEIDFVLTDDDRVRSIPEAIGAAPRFDWVMASHVVEHVPNLVDWLAQIAEVTVDGGALILAVPDRRYCFDVHRPPTTVGQLLEAHERGERIPSVRAVYDHNHSHVRFPVQDAWQGRMATYGDRVYGLDYVQDRMATARSGRYVDSHVWVFTPGTFAEQIVELRELGLSSWAIESISPTVRGDLEFHVVLRRLPRDGVWDAAWFGSEPEPATMPDWLSGVIDRRQRREEQRQRLNDQRDRIRRLEEQLRQARSRRRSLRERLRTMTSSRRWRLGGVLGAPARALRRRPS